MTNSLVTSDTESAGLFLIEQAMGYAYSAALRAAAIIGVADHLVDRPKTPEELGALTKADGQKLHRILRLLAARGVFREDEQGRYELNAAADLLRSNVPLSVRAAVMMLTSTSQVAPAFELATGLRGGDISFEALFGTTIWEHRGKDLSPEEDFHHGMSSMSEPEIQSPGRGYDFPNGATVVDVGGGYGALLLWVLRHHPTLRGILFDQEHVLAKHRLGELGADDRWETAAGDFFERCPPGDIYLLKYITHDWNDAQAARILRTCREAMAPGGRVLAFDTVIPTGNTWHFGKLMDMLVMGTYPGRERTEEDFRQLFADAGLRVSRIISSDSYLSIVEGVEA